MQTVPNRIPACLVAAFTIALAVPIQAQPAPRRPAPAPSPAGLSPFPFAAFPSVDGTGNNPALPQRGAVGEVFRRVAPPAYADGDAAPSGSDRPGARLVSNLVCAQEGPLPNARGASDFVYQWGQFVDHDITLTATSEPEVAFDIPVPAGDASFDPDGTGTAVIPFARSLQERVRGRAEQVNLLSACIDGSMVYGSDADTAARLRALDGTGRMRVSEGGLPPFATIEAGDGTVTETPFFDVGDIRGNEQIRLLALHALFLREHNFWADHFRRAAPSLDDEALYQLARTVVVAEIQSITYREWLPVVLGRDPLPPYRGWQGLVDPTLTNEFSTAAFRFGHSLLDTTLWRLDAALQPVPQGHVALRDAFFTPWLVGETGIEPILRGLAVQRAQELDAQVVEDVRSFLFGAPGAGGLDLAALNIQRGRDHGLPAYNAVRRALGLRPAADFADITRDRAAAARLQAAYGTVARVDLWIGGLSEPHVRGGLVGETFHAILRDQFRRIRDGDRFWHEGNLPPSWRAVIERVRLADIIRRNTGVRGEIPDNVFVVPSAR